MGVQAGLELQDRLELLVRVEGDLDHAVDVVEAVPVLEQKPFNDFKFLGFKS